MVSIIACMRDDELPAEQQDGSDPLDTRRVDAVSPAAARDRCALTVVIPVYNEAATIRHVIQRVCDALHPMGLAYEVVVVDDGSIDGTPVALEGVDGAGWMIVLRHIQNRGKGAAIRSALGVASGEVIVIQDADLEYAPTEIPRLVQPILRGQADVVYGSRFHHATENPGTWHHRLANGFLTGCSRIMTGLSVTDMETGHKAFRRVLLDGIEIEEDGFGVEPELTAKLASRGIRFQEILVGYSPRTRHEGKKIRLRDGLRALWCIWRYRRP